MKWAVIVNRVSEVHAEQATWLVAACAAARGHDVWLVEVGHLSLTDAGEVIATGWLATGALDATQASTPTLIALNAMDLVLIRTNPGRDLRRAWAHEATITMLAMLDRGGVTVLNRPQGLRQAGSKLYGHIVPRGYRPETLVSTDPERVVAFAAQHPEGIVLKPLVGSQGTGVAHFRQQDEALRAAAAAIATNGYIFAQAFIPEAPAGDTRIIVVDGAPLVVDGVVAAVCRVPAAGDFRSNIAAGGRAAPASLGARHLEMVRAIGPSLRADGLFVVGIDVVGDFIVELNVFSAGGLADAMRFTGRDFVSALVSAYETRAA